MMSIYLIRVEHIVRDWNKEFFNIRPVLEKIEDGFVEVDKSKFGQYGTIQITHIFGKLTDNPWINDDVYLMFELSDEDLNICAQNDYKIKAEEFVERSKLVDSYGIREVISIDDSYNLREYNSWQNETISGILKPITNHVFLKNKKCIIGPLCYKQKSNSEYQFLPVSDGDNDFIVNVYNEDDFDIIYTFDASASLINYHKTRQILTINILPQTSETIDCISGKALKDYLVELLKNQSSDRELNSDIKQEIMTLPASTLAESRKKRILEMLKDANNIKDFVQYIPKIILQDKENMEILLQKILDNSNYSNKVYSVIKNNENFDSFFRTLNIEKQEKIEEINKLEEKKTLLQTQIKKFNNENISVAYTEEIQKVLEENKVLKVENDKYKKEYNLRNEIDLLVKEKKQIENKKTDVENDYNQLLKLKESISEDIQKKVREAYMNFAFDGALSSMLMQEAANFEKDKKKEIRKQHLIRKAEIKSLSHIDNPRELVEFIYNELKFKANRVVPRNDIANILLCLSQGFLTILAGEPGSGKTSLVSLIAHILGLDNENNNRYEEIAVEKGWTSRRDFIGYYNPLTKTFDMANKGMLNALETIDGEYHENIEDFLYLILLDEANLSQMEYYWADFMSLCDFDKPRRKISLGEDYTYDISKVLRFIATINLDHTTEILSPRLIDRAWIILLQASDLLIEDEENNNLDIQYDIVGFDVFDKLNSQSYFNEKILNSNIVEKFNEIRRLFQTININFSPRIIKMIKRYCLASNLVMNDSDNVYVSLDYAISQKILPIINGYGTNYAEFLDKLLEECDQNSMPRSYEIIKNIKRKGDINMQYYQFFAR